MKKILGFLLLSALFFRAWEGQAQSISLNAPMMEEYMRRQQLLGNVDSTFSFAIRPILPEMVFGKKDGIDLDGSFLDYENSNYHSITDDEGRFNVLPLIMNNQFTSKYSFGINNGAMIPARGMQTLVSGGFFYKIGKLSLQVQPELVVAQNKDFLGFPVEHRSTVLYYYEWMNRIDAPERFGQRTYTSLHPGQSSLRYNVNGVSFGLSSENLWWGPAKRNSLMLSNNAPGFWHLTANTQKPFQTTVGAFEGQLIAGYLENSQYQPPHSDYVWQQTTVYQPKRDRDGRYLSGLILSYQPNWVPGLFLGFSSVSQMYFNDMEGFSDWLPVFNGEKGSRSVVNPRRDKRYQMSSGFFRWMSPKGHFEFYGEFGTKGNDRVLEEFLTVPELNRAFTFGFVNYQRLKKDGYLQVAMEITQTGQTVRETIRNVDSWYVHHHVRHGYTHRGQVLGAGNGPGSNVIFAEVSWIKDFNRIGLQFERIVYNNDFYYFRFEHIKDWRVKYVDMVPSVVGDWRFGNLLLYSRIQYVNTLNYKWYIVNQPNQYFIPGWDRKNFVANIGLNYILK
jgi:hypothetical protein